MQSKHIQLPTIHSPPRPQLSATNNRLPSEETALLTSLLEYVMEPSLVYSGTRVPTSKLKLYVLFP